ncbi:hypothetical protein CEUSTIGMA_g2588.t1 [Chlamydomonas eustigma]|uniref:Chromatin modification-related protein MEAF6 n=1 Tax=Chlamydomonas eustigma TaxID=1157962 RepID=A0A250WWD2_9CHLO|nr:hypothetical protein CEUSTIGMA_g2588.t1 [Chlamydomonas eustigma]|eukprot:GAX75144.1 hypothetical protein CEUSTIGMA_g2588.t1 [Chlamydomonas eustigma]
MEEYAQFKNQLESELIKTERLIADVESSFINAEHCQNGSILRGYEGFLSTKESLRKRQRLTKGEERLFSLSSKTSPVAREQDQGGLEQLEGLATTPGGHGKKGYAQKGYAQKGYAQKR